MWTPGPGALSVAEASARLGISRGTLHNLTCGNPVQIRSVRINGRRWISEASLEQYEEARRRKVAELKG